MLGLIGQNHVRLFTICTCAADGVSDRFRDLDGPERGVDINFTPDGEQVYQTARRIQGFGVEKTGRADGNYPRAAHLC